MLKKLLKVDLKYIFKPLFIFYILTIFFAITTRILFSLEETTFIKIVSQISVGCFYSMAASILINTLMRNWVRFKDSMYGDTSYLTHTLPVTKKQIYDSKFITSLLSLLVSLIVVVIGVAITYYTKERMDLLITYVNNYLSNFELNKSFYITSLIVVLYLEVYSMLQCGFLGIIFGNKKLNGQNGYSVLYGFIVYIITQTLVFIVIFVIALFNADVMKLFTSNIMEAKLITPLIIVSLITYFVIIVAEKIIAIKSLENGVNVD